MAVGLDKTMPLNIGGGEVLKITAGGAETRGVAQFDARAIMTEETL